jgi:hypothetical protein
MYDANTCISLHTIALRRGRRIGAHLFAAKQEHAVENLGSEEVFVTAESPRGFNLLALEWGLEYREGLQHELGGAKCWVLTKEAYHERASGLVFGRRPVPQEIYEETLSPGIIEPDILREESD